MAVLDTRHSDIQMKQEQSDLVQGYILEALNKLPAEVFPSQFLNTFAAEILWMHGAKKHTENWLCQVIKEFHPSWEDASVTVKSIQKTFPKR